MIELSKNKNPYFPTEEMYNFLSKKVKYISNYPSANLKNCENLFSRILNIPGDNIKIVNGTMEGMDVLLKALNKSSIGIFNPTFWGIKYVVEKNGYTIIEEKMDNYFKYDIDALRSLADKVDVLYLCNPNNPTLAYISKDELLSIVQSVPTCHFIIDETILSFDVSFNNKTVYNLVTNVNNLSVLISLSKILSLPGLRIGLALTNNDIAKIVSENQIVYSTNILAEKFLEKYYIVFDKLDLIRNKIKKNFDFLEEQLVVNNKINKVISNNGSFILVGFSNHIDTIALQQYLKTKDILVSSMKLAYPNFFGNYIRVSAGKHSDFEKLIIEINNYLKEND